MNTSTRLADRILKSLRSGTSGDLMGAFMCLGEDSPIRAQIALDILSKAIDRSKLVRVQRTISRNGKSYVTHLWVLPSKVEKNDVVIQNKGVYEQYLKGSGKDAKAGAQGKLTNNPMQKLQSKKAGAVKPKAKSTPKPAAKPTAKPESKPETKPKPEGKPTSKPQSAAKPTTKPQAAAKPEKKPKPAPKPKKDKNAVTDAKLSSMMRTLTVGEVKQLIASGKLKLTEAQQAKVDAWEAEEKRKKERFEGAGLTPAYRVILEKRYDDATPDAQKAYDKYAVKIADCVADSHSGGGGKYKIYMDRIFFDCRDDSIVEAGRRPPGSTLQHELGHLIDYRAKGFTGLFDGKNTVSNDAEFLDAIRSDVRAAEQAMKEQMLQDGWHKVPIKEARRAIARDMVKYGHGATAGVQDIFGGVIKKQYPGALAYHYENYWKCLPPYGHGTENERNEQLGTEAFANMYEACSNKEAAQAMEKWLPNAFRRFKEILAEIANS